MTISSIVFKWPDAQSAGLASLSSVYEWCTCMYCAWRYRCSAVRVIWCEFCIPRVARPGYTRVEFVHAEQRELKTETVTLNINLWLALLKFSGKYYNHEIMKCKVKIYFIVFIHTKLCLHWICSKMKLARPEAGRRYCTAYCDRRNHPTIKHAQHNIPWYWSNEQNKASGMELTTSGGAPWSVTQNLYVKFNSHHFYCYSRSYDVLLLVLNWQIQLYQTRKPAQDKHDERARLMNVIVVWRCAVPFICSFFPHFTRKRIRLLWDRNQFNIDLGLG